MINLSYGLEAGAGIAFFFLAIYLKWGEKFVLVSSRARYVNDDEALINQLKNFCTHLEIPSVKIYWSASFANNIYYGDSPWGVPVLIIGKNIYQTFSRNELNSLIYASLLKIKTGEAKNRTLVSLLFFTLYSPAYIIRKFFKSKKMQAWSALFFYPAFALKKMMYENESFILEFDHLVGKMHGLKKDYLAALFKVSHLNALGEKTTGALLLAELSHAPNASDDIVASLLFKTVDIKTRIKALSAAE